MLPLQFEYDEVPGLVSIVMPMRNARQFLDETLAGIINQSYAGWELIVIEDGSKDGSREIIDEFARQNPHHRVVYLRNESSCGASYSRNRGFMASRGEYIALLDCDDNWLTTHLEASVESLEESSADLSYSTSVMYADSDGAPIGLWGPTPVEIHTFPQSLFERNFITPSSCVWRRSTMGEIGAWSAKFNYCEDGDFFMRAALAGKKFIHIAGVHCMYRKEHAGAMTQKLADTLEGTAYVFSRYLNSPNVHRKSAARALAKISVLAANCHLTRSREIDPSANPARAAGLYYKAWRLHKKRWKFLIKSIACRLRYGTDPGLQPIDRPSVPLVAVQNYQRKAA